MKNSITERIFKVIEDNDLNNNQLAVKLGIHRTVVSEWKSGKSQPSPKIILKILYHFPNVDANWLIRGEEKKGNTHYGLSINSPVLNDSESNYNEVEHLKEIIKEKNEHIKLLKKMLNMKE